MAIEQLIAGDVPQTSGANLYFMLWRKSSGVRPTYLKKFLVTLE